MISSISKTAVSVGSRVAVVRVIVSISIGIGAPLSKVVASIAVVGQVRGSIAVGAEAVGSQVVRGHSKRGNNSRGFSSLHLSDSRLLGLNLLNSSWDNSGQETVVTKAETIVAVSVGSNVARVGTVTVGSVEKLGISFGIGLRGSLGSGNKQNC